MRQIRLNVAALAAALVLLACGGSGGNGGGGSGSAGGNATITGLAATGAALGNASLAAKCSAGLPLSSRTAADGTFSLELNGGQALPCLLQVTSGLITLHGFATEAGHTNITPLTDLVINRALGADAAAAFADYEAIRGIAIRLGLAVAKVYVKAEITVITGSAPAGDPLTGVFRIGDRDDQVLDKLGAALAAAGKKLEDLRLGALSGGSLRAALDRGSLVEPAVVLTTLTAAQIDAGTASGLQAISGQARCDVKVVALNYNTVGVQGEKTNASGVMLVPAGSCSAASGLVAYAKGTDVRKPRTLASPADGETFLLAAMYAAQGYTVVATDYLGYAKSAYAYHPYLHANSEATSVVDSIRAARKAATSVGAALSGKVMLTGYSQGGHSSMAAHRAIERNHASEINVVAGAHLAGPYNLSGLFKLTNAIAGYQFFAPFLVTSWQKVYGNIYSSPSVAFKAPYDSYIESLLPHPTLDTSGLITTGRLPGGPGVSPNQARDLIFQPAFLAEIQTNNSPLLLAAKKNDLLGWSPKSRLLLCGGAGDPTVPQAVHQLVMKADFDSRGLTNVSSVDVDPLVRATYGVGGQAPTDPASAAFATYFGNYHGSYQPPFCHASARSLFNAVN